ncbi:MAG: hypothetical protein ACREJ3_15245, partial [Polyangiaceae bacterium]
MFATEVMQNAPFAAGRDGASDTSGTVSGGPEGSISSRSTGNAMHYQLEQVEADSYRRMTWS